MDNSENSGKKDQQKHTVKEVAAMENHAELIDDVLVITDQTSVMHNNAVLEIAMAMRQFIASNGGKCKVFTENVALYCNELSKELSSDKGNLYLPDVMAVCGENGIKDDGIHTAPVFVAEVTSESTRRNDYGKKMLTYSEIGVQEYWVVDLQRKVVVRYLAENGFAPEVFAYANAATLPIQTYPGLTIDLARIFA